MATTILGKPCSWFVYAMGAASLIESTVFIVHYAEIITDVNKYRNSNSGPWINRDSTLTSALVISIFNITINSLRCMFAVIAVFGQYMETIKTLFAFLIFIFLGAIANIFTGVMGMRIHWTSSVAAGTLGIVALHIAYLILGIYIYQLEVKNIMPNRPGISVAPGHVPYELPVQTTITIPPTAPNSQILEQQQPFNPYIAPAPDVHYLHMPQSPPSYDQSSASSGGPPYVESNDKRGKGQL